MPLPNDPSLFVQRATDFALATNYGDPIRTPSTYDKPYSLYLIYISLSSNGQLIIRQLYEEDYDKSLKVEEVETTLFEQAVKNDNVLSKNFENLAWNTPTYITFVINVPNWKFYWRDLDTDHDGKVDVKRDGIIFRKEKDTHIGKKKDYKQNKSFLDGTHTHVEDKAGKKYDAIRCVNYVLDGNGKKIPLGGDPVDYCFEIYIEARFNDDSPTSKYITIIIDPDGQNQGPKTA